MNLLRIAAIFLVCFIVVGLPFVVAGFPEGSDEITHLRFAVTYDDAFKAGHMQPAWMMDNSGFGGVGVRFYPPVSSVTSVASKWITGNWYDAFCLNILMWMAIGCLGIYEFTQLFASKNVAMIAGLLYAITPYHVAQIFQYLLYAEFIALSILPFCLLFLTRLLRKPNLHDSLLLSVSCSLLLLTHLPLFILGSLSMSVYALFLIDRKNRRMVFRFLLPAAGLSIVATSFYWLRLVTEINWVAHTTQEFASGHYDFRNWFFPTSAIDHTGINENLSAWLFDRAIVVTALLLIPAAVFFIVSPNRWARENRGLAGLFFGGLFSFFMLSRSSEFLWQILPLIKQVQFPWRWLSPLSFFGVSSFVIATALIVRDHRRLARPVVYAGVFIVLGIVLYDWTQSIKPAGGQTRAEFQERVDNLMGEPYAAYWRPIWAKDEALANKKQVTIGDRAVDIVDWRPEHRQFVIESGHPQNARIATFYYPYWKAAVNGLPETVSMDENGTILIPTPAERSEVTLYFDEPLQNKIALIIAVFAWVTISGLLIIKRKF